MAYRSAKMPKELIKLTDTFYDFEEFEKTFWFAISSQCTDFVFTAVKMDANF